MQNKTYKQGRLVPLEAAPTDHTIALHVRHNLLHQLQQHDRPLRPLAAAEGLHEATYDQMCGVRAETGGCDQGGETVTATRAAGGNHTTRKNQKPEAEAHKPNTQTKRGLAALGPNPALYPEVEQQQLKGNIPHDQIDLTTYLH